MIRSMTGFGFSEYFLYNRHISVSIKSVNSRFSEISIKMPSYIDVYENDIKNIIKEEVSRGKVDVNITIFSNSEDDFSVVVDEVVLDKYYEKISLIKTKYNISDTIKISDLIALDGVLKLTDVKDPDILCDIWETLFVALNNALDDFIKSRELEGNSLKNDILSKIDVLNYLLDKICLLVPVINDLYKQKLTKKVKLLLEDKAIDEARLLTEVAIFSDKASIDEEIVRLSAHISSFKNIILNENVVGRKLEFILQEMNREVNTMASKSYNVEISNHLIEMKSLLEMIREQIQNIE